MKKLEAVIFDMDGVLFDTERMSCECCFEAAKQQLGLTLAEESMSMAAADEMKRHFAGHIMETEEPWYPNGTFPYEKYRERFMALFQERLERELPVKKGVRELLEYLKEKQIKTAIASSTKGPLVRKHLERTGLSGYFQEIVSGDMVEKSKPEPDIYLKACEAVGVLPENAMGIEDSFNGIRAVAAAGMTAVMVPDMVQPDEEIRQIYDYCVQDLLEVKELIELLA